MEQAMMVAGFGCRRAASADDLAAALDLALAAGCIDRSALSAVAFPYFRKDHPGVQAALACWSLPGLSIDQAALVAASVRAETHSAFALSHTGLSSVAESAALAAAGRDSRLLSKRVTAGGATCAIAIGDQPA